MGAQQLPHRPPWTWGTLVFRFGSGLVLLVLFFGSSCSVRPVRFLLFWFGSAGSVLRFVLFRSSGSVPPVLVWVCWFCSSVRPVPCRLVRFLWFVPVRAG